MTKIAFIAAFPPPITGQSLAAELLRNGLKDAGIPYYELDLAEPVEGTSLLRRIGQLAGVEARLALLCIKHRDLVVYLQLGHGKAAVLRDLVFMATAAVFRRPCVGHVHGSGFRNALEQLPSPIRLVERSLVHRLRAAVVLSESLREMFRGLLDEDKIIAVDNGIDPEFVQMTDGERDFGRSELHVLFLSNFLTAKGFSTLLRTASLARDAGKHWVFDFVGARVPNQDVDIDEYIRDYGLNNVVVHDVVSGRAKHEAYQMGDIFILPSSYEGQPLSILEAMFESLPVITTHVGGIPEIFSDDTGVRYVEPGDPQQIFEALCELEDPEIRWMMGAANRELAMSRFTAQKHVDRMIEILHAKD